MTKDDSYQLQTADRLLIHGPGRPRLLGDGAELSDGYIAALVASGDCLVTLATALDEATQYLATEPEAARPQMERVISILLHLQRHYKLAPKPADLRQ